MPLPHGNNKIKNHIVLPDRPHHCLFGGTSDLADPDHQLRRRSGRFGRLARGDNSIGTGGPGIPGTTGRFHDDIHQGTSSLGTVNP